MNREILISYLQRVLPMPADKAVQLADHFTYKEFGKNDFLIKAGKINNESHFLQEGYIRSYTFDTEGNEVITALYTAPCFANDFLSFFRRQPGKEHIQTLTACKTWFLDYEGVQHLFHSVPEFREFGRLLLINNYGVLKERMLGMIQHTAEQRYDTLITGKPDIFQHVPLKMIASYLGITDTSLSRIRREYSKK